MIMKQGQRLELWEIRNGAHCSVIGTCLGPADVKAVLRKAKLEREAGAPDYQVHGFLVNEAARQGPVGGIIDAYLDKKYAGAIRQSLRLRAEDAILAYWQEACRRGAIAGPYWALHTLPDLPPKLAARIFGDVHMLGHFMGGANRADQAALWAAEQRLEELGSRLRKVRTRAEERDLANRARIDVLERELASLRAEAAVRPLAMAGRPKPDHACTQERRLAKHGRKLAALRARLAQLAATNATLEARLAQRERLPLLPATLADPAQCRPPEQPAACRVAMLRCLLYVGGRPSSVPHLRAGAERIAAEFLHHYGGVEESVSRLDALVLRADIVFCPVDCVSHDASLRARALCRRHAKPFVPLRSASATCFRRQVEALAPRRASEQDAPR
jgi:hypothetical protein